MITINSTFCEKLDLLHSFQIVMFLIILLLLTKYQLLKHHRATKAKEVVTFFLHFHDPFILHIVNVV